MIVIEIDETQKDYLVACMELAVMKGGEPVAQMLTPLFEKLNKLDKDAGNAGDTDAGV